jgi:hypothetical protein
MMVIRCLHLHCYYVVLKYKHMDTIIVFVFFEKVFMHADMQNAF